MSSIIAVSAPLSAPRAQPLTAATENACVVEAVRDASQGLPATVQRADAKPISKRLAAETLAGSQWNVIALANALDRSFEFLSYEADQAISKLFLAKDRDGARRQLVTQIEPSIAGAAEVNVRLSLGDRAIESRYICATNKNGKATVIKG